MPAEHSPILCNPYLEPDRHYDADLEGNLIYERPLPGRRPYLPYISIAPDRSTGALFTSGDLDTGDGLINDLRRALSQWRAEGYPRTTRTTRRLLAFWFTEPREPQQRLFFCQREAVETAIYLNEAADTDPNTGRALLHRVEDSQATVSSDYAYQLPRTAFKMATGTGKTVVMAMLILYNYLNRRAAPQDTRFADHFLLLTPSITIRDRLAVLYIDQAHSTLQQQTDYYHQRHLVPPGAEDTLCGLNAAVTIANFHQLSPRPLQGKKASPMDGKLHLEADGTLRTRSGAEPYSAVISRLLGRMPKSRRLLVVNDEAHHCYLPRKTRAKAGDDADNDAAMVWYEGLRQMKALGYRLNHVYDLSATPYYLRGSGYPEYSLFPWTVTDFGLVEAIESGLVKIPFLPVFDDSHQLTEPVLRNIYEHIRHELPKKGQRSARRDGTSPSSAAPHLPALLSVALEQFYADYTRYELSLGAGGEASRSLFTTPPVMIVVCNNTSVSREVFRHIAGFETTTPDGRRQAHPGALPLFSNYRDGLAVQKPPTLLIDSEAIDTAGGTVNETFRQTFREEIARFKREYADMHGAGAADTLTDGDILREVVNTVGRPQALGAHVRCVVSVSMLTEGWDANTVTHVVGIRAFGSQLLCEQVAGRALRRRSYDLAAYDAQGREIPAADIHRYSPRNITYKFPPEYAHIIGVPFTTFKGNAGASGTARPPHPVTRVYALPEREALEIRFPVVTGYRVESCGDTIAFDYSGLPPFRLDFNRVPLKTTLSSAIADTQGGKRVVLSSDYATLRDHEVLYHLTQRLLSEKYASRENGSEFQLFHTLMQAVTAWYDTKLEVLGGPGERDVRRLVVFWDRQEVTASIYEGIRRAAASATQTTAILDYYNPEGSTVHVNALTQRPVFRTSKSHVNCVVADTDSWEQIAAKTLEQMPQVTAYVKNAFLGFTIPYISDGQEHTFEPDFLARVQAPGGETFTLIIEISGRSDDRHGHKDHKRHYTLHYWLPAVNALGKYGRWAFVEITDIDNILAELNAAIQHLPTP